MPDLHPNAAKVQAALDELGVPGQVRELTEPAPTAATAAAALGIEVGQVANSLIFNADGLPVLVMTSGAHKCNTAVVAQHLGAHTVTRADADFVRAATGQPIGGVAPVGHPTKLRTIVDTHLDTWEQVWAAGGHPHYVFPTSFAELVRMTNGSPLAVGFRS